MSESVFLVKKVRIIPENMFIYILNKVVFKVFRGNMCTCILLVCYVIVLVILHY